MSSVVPIPKTPTNSENPSNYRPISLLSVVSKLLEKHIYGLVFEHMVDRNMLSQDQWGFTPGKSTVTALISTFYDILQNMDKGLEVSLVFFDIRKAFDSVPHLPLLLKLHDLGLNKHILQWITSYLCDRHQLVVVEGASSEPTPVVSGVPQGSILGPLLFLIYINHVSSLSLSDGSKLTMYADDILLFKPIRYQEDYYDLQDDINTIHLCIKSSFLTLNAAKCKYIIASRKKHPCIPLLGLSLGTEIMERVESYRYLGVHVTSNLTWTEHISQICTKARKLVGMLYRRYSKWADTDTLRCIYLTCIRPHLEYACQLWDPYINKMSQNLESIQKFACRVCLKRWDLSYNCMLQKLDLLPLTSRRKYLKLTTLYNMFSGNSYFPSGIFVQNNLNYSNWLRNSHVPRFVRPFARTNYFYSSFVPSVISDWNALPNFVTSSTSVSSFKRSLLYHFSEDIS